VILGRAVSAVIAFGVTCGLFLLMQALITKAAGELQEPTGSLVDFVRLKKDTEPELKKRELPKMQKPEEPPPPPDLNLTRSARPDQGLEGMELDIGMGFDLAAAGPSLGAIASDADVVPVVRVNPQYPPRAAERGIEGWVELEFTVGQTGAVRDAEVTKSHPGSVFDRAALRAVRKWKYNPKIENGKPVERTGIRVRLAFRLADG
jgi:protein TonB